MLSPPSPPIAEYTPRAPYAVGPKEPLGNARRLMEKYALRDLPVRHEGKLVGMLSGPELRLLWTLAPPPQTTTVEQAMTAAPYAVTATARLDEVVREMIDKGLDAAVVLEEGRVLGVFTCMNAMEALVDVLEHKHGRTVDRTRPGSPKRATRGRDGH